jgi:uncharacterized membrane protein
VTAPPRDPAHPSDDLVLPSQDDPVVAGTAEALGGPPGQHALLGERRFWTPVRWLLLLTLVTCFLGWLQKAPCRDPGNWQNEYQYTRLCYTDVSALYFAEGLVAGKTPYADHPVEYPVVIGAVMQVAAEGAKLFPEGERPQRFYDITWAILTACALVVVVTTARLAGRRRPWDAAMFAAAPLLVLHGTTNWDLVAMALVGLGLVQWSRSHPLAAGLLLGAATATKLYAVLFLVPLLALCWRAGRMKAFATTAVALILTPIALSLPVYLTSPSFIQVGNDWIPAAASPLERLGDEGLAALAPTTEVISPDGTPARAVNAAYRFFDLNSSRPADWDAGWRLLQKVMDRPLDENLAPGEAPHNLNRGVALSFLLCLGLIVLLTLKAPRRPRLMPLLFLTVFAFLLTNKVWSPQFSLWLVPLALLARPRWRPLLAWQAAEALVLFTRFYFFLTFGEDNDGIADGWYIAALLLRDASLLIFAGFVIRDVLQPERDVVRADGTDDPAGGVLDGAPDRGDEPQKPARPPTPELAGSRR